MKFNAEITLLGSALYLSTETDENVPSCVQEQGSEVICVLIGL